MLTSHCPDIQISGQKIEIYVTNKRLVIWSLGRLIRIFLRYPSGTRPVLYQRMAHTPCNPKSVNLCLGGISSSRHMICFPNLCKLIVTHFLNVIKKWLYVPIEISELRTAAKSLHMALK